jgi:hypothetical protein
MKTKIILIMLLLIFTAACSVNQPTERVIVDKDVSYGDDPLMKYDVKYKQSYENAPVIFVVHGGAEGSGDKSQSDSVTTYTDVNFVVVNINYRYSTAEYSTSHDIACAMATFREQAKNYGADPNNLLLQAGSAGNGRAGPIYFYPENDWLAGCPYKKDFELKGYVSKSGFHLGESSVKDITFELDESGVTVIGPEEVLDNVLEIKGLLNEIEDYPEDLNHEEANFKFIQGGAELIGPPELISFFEEIGQSTIFSLTDSFVNHIDSTDNSVLLIYGEADNWWERRPEEPEKFRSALQEEGVKHTYISIADQGHGIRLSNHPKVEKLTQKYILAIANNEPLPSFFNRDKIKFELKEK